MKKPITITVDHNNETLVFKLLPLVDLDVFLDVIDMIVSPLCVEEFAEDGYFEII